LIGPEGEQIGIVPTSEALSKARHYNLDLVEVSPTSRPPVCRILDFGKYKYEQSKKEKQAKKKQHSFQLKEMRFRPKIDEHDYNFKTKHIREFLESGSKVRVFVMFRGRELAYTEMGQDVLKRVIEDLADISIVDMPPKMEGKSLSLVLSPNAAALKNLKAARSAREAREKKDKIEKLKSETPEKAKTEQQI
jgi:translation initiation factor IF-3